MLTSMPPAKSSRLPASVGHGTSRSTAEAEKMPPPRKQSSSAQAARRASSAAKASEGSSRAKVAEGSGSKGSGSGGAKGAGGSGGGKGAEGQGSTAHASRRTSSAAKGSEVNRGGKVAEGNGVSKEVSSSVQVRLPVKGVEEQRSAAHAAQGSRRASSGAKAEEGNAKRAQATTAMVVHGGSNGRKRSAIGHAHVGAADVLFNECLDGLGFSQPSELKYKRQAEVRLRELLSAGGGLRGGAGEERMSTLQVQLHPFPADQLTLLLAECRGVLQTRSLNTKRNHLTTAQRAPFERLLCLLDPSRQCHPKTADRKASGEAKEQRGTRTHYGAANILFDRVLDALGHGIPSYEKYKRQAEARLHQTLHPKTGVLNRAAVTDEPRASLLQACFDVLDERHSNTRRNHFTKAQRKPFDQLLALIAPAEPGASGSVGGGAPALQTSASKTSASKTAASKAGAAAKRARGIPSGRGAAASKLVQRKGADEACPEEGRPAKVARKSGKMRAPSEAAGADARGAKRARTSASISIGGAPAKRARARL